MELIRIKDKMYLVDKNNIITIDKVFVDSSPKKNIRRAKNWIIEENSIISNHNDKFLIIHSFDGDRKILISKVSRKWKIFIPDLRKRKIGWLK